MIYPIKYFSIKEEQTIRGALNGDPTCQKAIFDKYAGKMMAVCMRYGRHRMEAEDMMQDSFIKVFRFLHQYTFEGSFEGWIRRIVVNTAIKSVGKKSFKNELYGVEHVKENYADPEVVSKLGKDDLMKILSTLPHGYKTIFNLFVVEGFSHKEISEKLGIQESTSRSQLVKARKMLKIKIIEASKIAV